MSTVLFLSPHLDDVAFSCGGTLSVLKSLGWQVALATVFTRSVPQPSGFALACQTDKGLSAEVDYMELRRQEDQDFAARMGVDRMIWAGLPEAPHRGYGSAPELFQPPREDDTIGEKVVERLAPLVERLRPELIFAPQCLGSHVDHVQLTRVLPRLGVKESRTLWYRDTPYAVRQPEARPDASLPGGVRPLAVNVRNELKRKVEGCQCYRTQVDFQFGGAHAVGPTLEAFHQREASSLGATGHAETFLVSATFDAALRRELTQKQ